MTDGFFGFVQWHIRAILSLSRSLCVSTSHSPVYDICPGPIQIKHAAVLLDMYINRTIHALLDS